jgi:hypothetical protein
MKTQIETNFLNFAGTIDRKNNYSILIEWLGEKYKAFR